MDKIKLFKEEYLEKSAKLLILTFNREPWNENWTFETAFKRLEETYKTPNFKGWVYEKDNKIVGVIMGNCEQWYEGTQYYIKDFFVDANIQKQGIGSKMLKHLERELKDLDVNFIHFWTLKGEKTEKFYKNNGYELPNTLTLMTKDLDSE
ncbi:GNAT family N-acetyltransferase [Clostridium sp. MB40-C1]|uniref:GNAT family N-acetyltransferase n=1 Tax=Clostridium sp. MB40-C1 TaxID=3070996 RepID=UPI0027E0E6B5|nr:GNAT family N-acetyltransferase [Clostridium sp. MB40-C1]WMJ80951.1 GNAT family N-acetyltransferase [Clostridium sp. MB40-C1]